MKALTANKERKRRKQGNPKKNLVPRRREVRKTKLQIECVTKSSPGNVHDMERQCHKLQQRTKCLQRRYKEFTRDMRKTLKNTVRKINT